MAYGDGILSEPLDLDAPASKRAPLPKVAGVPGLAVVDRNTGKPGTLMRIDSSCVVLRDAAGRDTRITRQLGRFAVDGRPVDLVPPAKTVAVSHGMTASGSVATPETPARIARASRIKVEGIHDAELLEKVWGDDLRYEGIVVEPMHGMDDLTEVVSAFQPREGRRLGILLDHLVEGTKEWHVAQRVDNHFVLITGHPYVDVWEAVKPKVAGLDAWPTIPMGTPWKEGICAALGGGEPGRFWRTLLGRVSSYTDLEPSLVGAVEQLIDFVATQDA